MTGLAGGHAGGSAEIEAVRLLAAQFGLSVAASETATCSNLAPTFAEYVPVVSEATSDGACRVYGPYWQRLVQQWGHRRLDEPTASEIGQFAEGVRAQAVTRRNGRDGRSAAEHFVSALRCLYAQAVADGLLSETDNPARRVDKPRRLPSTRRALAEEWIAEITRVAVSTGNDPALDSLLLRLHIETACRRGGALALRYGDLDVEQ